MITRGLAGSLLVLLGGLVVSILPTSTPLEQVEMFAALRESMPGRMVGLGVILLGLGLLAGAWLSLCRYVAVADRTHSQDSIDLVRLATLVWSLPLLLAPPLFSRDGWSYAAQGTLAHIGLSPYEYGPGVLGDPVTEAVDPMWMNTPAPYGPVPVAFGALAAAQTGDPWLLVIAHRGLALAGLVMLAWAMPRLAAWTGVNPGLASALVIASPLMMATGVGGLHNDLLMVGLMAVALVLAAERGWWWGAVLGGVAAAVKLPGGLVCLGVVLLSLPAAAGTADRLVRYGQVAAVSVATLLGLGLVTGLGTGWVQALAVPASINTPLSITTVAGGLLDWLAQLLGLGLEPTVFRDLVRNLGTLAALCLAGRVALRWRTGDRPVALAGVAASMAALVVLSPVVHLWYFLWLTPFVATLRLPRAGVAGFLALSVILGLVGPLDSSLHGAYLAIVFGVMLVSVLTPILLLTRPARERIDRIATSRWLVVH